MFKFCTSWPSQVLSGGIRTKLHMSEVSKTNALNIMSKAAPKRNLRERARTRKGKGSQREHGEGTWGGNREGTALLN